MAGINWNRDANRDYAISLGRAFAGAIIFSLPLLMTMEMWWLGFTLDKFRLLQFVAMNFLVLIGLARLSGFEPTFSWADDVLDAFAAFAVAVFASAFWLALLGVIDGAMPASEIVGKIAIQSVPASFGAMLASKQLGHSDEVADPKDEARDSYGGQLFLMLAGALFLAFNLAPTDEMMLISLQMEPWQAIVLVLVSIIMLHAFVYNFGFVGGPRGKSAQGFARTLFHFTLAGYGIALIVSYYVLWTFGRVEGIALPQAASTVAVLAFPAALGAAIGRLVV